MSWIDQGLSFVIEMWEMQLSFPSPVDKELENLLFQQSLLRLPRWVSREPPWLDLPFLVPRYCSVFVWDMTI